MWKNGEKEVFSTLFPHREKTQNLFFHTFSTLQKQYSTRFSTGCGKTMWKKLQARKQPRIVSISKFFKKFMYFFIIFIKTLVIFKFFRYNRYSSGGLWCVVVSFPQFPHSFPQFL
jgi:hypothetical protein